VLYECLAGRPPFLAGEAETLVRMHQREEPAPVSRSLESGPIADQLADVVHAMLAKEPGRRPSAAVARGELDSIHGKIAREQTSRVMVERKPRRWSLTRLFRP
jgi:serine/threonine-protein kinase